MFILIFLSFATSKPLNPACNPITSPQGCDIPGIGHVQMQSIKSSCNPGPGGTILNNGQILGKYQGCTFVGMDGRPASEKCDDPSFVSLRPGGCGPCGSGGSGSPAGPSASQSPSTQTAGSGLPSGEGTQDAVANNDSRTQTTPVTAQKTSAAVIVSGDQATLHSGNMAGGSSNYREAETMPKNKGKILKKCKSKNITTGSRK